MSALTRPHALASVSSRPGRRAGHRARRPGPGPGPGRERRRPDPVVRRHRQRRRQPPSHTRQAPHRHPGRRHPGPVHDRNSLSGTLAAPAGWTLLQTKDGTSTRGRAWTKQATAGDANTTLTVAHQRHHQGHHVRRGLPHRRRHLGRHRLRRHRRHHLDHHPHRPRRPRRPDRLLADQLLEREVLHHHHLDQARHQHHPHHPAATGSGKVSSLLADSNAPVPTGTAAARTATTSVAGGGTQLFSVVISPGTGTVTPRPTNPPCPPSPPPAPA